MKYIIIITETLIHNEGNCAVCHI